MRNFVLSPAFSLTFSIALTTLALGCTGDVKPGDTNDTGSDQDADTDSDTDADSDADSDTDTDTDTDVDCTATVIAFSPADGATDVAIDTSISASFSESVTEAQINLTDSAGASVPGSGALAGDGMSISFIADDMLERSSMYAVDVSVCSDDSASSFTTAGESTGVDLTDHTYDIDLNSSDITWIEPSASTGALLVSQLETDHLLIMVQSASTTIDTVAAAGLVFGGSLMQYNCAEAIDFPANSFAGNPTFTAGPMDATLSSGNTDVPVYDLMFNGTFSADGSSISNLEVTGLIDSRPVSESSGIDVCMLISCVACPDGVAACIDLDIIDASSPWESGLVLDPAIDPSADTHCDN